MDNKKFVKNLLLRSIPFVLVVVATIVLKVANLVAGDWWGWYMMYVLIFATLAFAVFYAAKNGRSLLINGVKKSFVKKSAQHFVEEWDKPEYNRENVVGYVYQSERDFDRTILFEEEKMVVQQVLRDEEGMVTGDNVNEEYAYNQIKDLSVVDIGGEGSAHIEIVYFNDRIEYAYFDVDLAKYLMDKSCKELKNIDQLKAYYLTLASKK